MSVTESAQALIEYAKRHGHVLAADDRGPMGVTPLHLAALLPDNGAMAELLVLQCLPGEPLARARQESVTQKHEDTRAVHASHWRRPTLNTRSPTELHTSVPCMPTPLGERLHC